MDGKVKMRRGYAENESQKKSMRLEVLLFGITKDIVGKQKLTIDVPSGTTVVKFKEILKTLFPGLQHLDSIAVAINSCYVKEDKILQPDDEIALIPPVSGG